MFEYASAIAGLGLFLSGLHFLSASMKPLAGKRMRILLSKLTGGYISSAFAGTTLGAITQSTSGATFVCMGLVNSGALKLKQALNVLAWSSVGGSLLVFLVSIDIRLAGLILVGIVGVSHLFNADRIDKIKYLVAIFFALGMLLLGLGMIKEGSHLLRESQWVRDFIEFASETTTICFIIGLLFTLVTQSASTATIIGITLVISGIVPFNAAVILVFGSNVGSGISLLLITSHLNGVQKQISVYQFLTKLCGVLFLMPIFMVAPGLFEPNILNAASLTNKSTIAFQVSIIYLLLQIAGAIMVSIFQSKITTLLVEFFPESEQDSLSKPKFIYPEAIEDPDIAITLIKKEQDRLISTLSYYLDPIRENEGDAMPVNDRNTANLQLANEIKQFIDELSHHELGQEMSSILELQGRNESIISLLNSLHSFTSTVSETMNYKEGLSGSIIESLHLILTLMEETAENDENIDLLMDLTSDKSQLMDNIRNTLLSDTTTDISNRKSLFVSTRVFERVLWQLRQMLSSKLQSI
jgi:phosphate:Na+ symporter